MNVQAETTGTELALPEPSALVAMFRRPEAVDDMLSRIEEEALATVADPLTAKGRKAIASLAYKVSQTKTALDDAGKKLNEGLRSQIAVVDTERRKIRERLDALRDDVRKPLTEWEAAEAARVQALKDRLARISGAAPQAETAEAFRALIGRVEAVAIDDSWQEMVADAARAKDATLARLRAGLASAEAREAQEAEIARLRAEAAAREEAERERLEAEAAEQRRLEAERAEAERAARVEREKQEAADRAAREAEARAKAKAERAKREAAEREADLQRQLAEAKAREGHAAQAERDRIEAERQEAEAARAKRAADAAHRARIQSEIAEALEAYLGMGSMGIADAIIGGAIPHVRPVL